MKLNTKLKYILSLTVCILSIFCISPKLVKSKETTAEMILFYSPSCPHCHHALEFLDSIENNYPDLKITKHNTSTSTGANYYFHYKKKLNIEGNGVPLAIFGEKYELGFDTASTTGKKYKEHIANLLQNN